MLSSSHFVGFCLPSLLPPSLQCCTIRSTVADSLICFDSPWGDDTHGHGPISDPGQSAALPSPSRKLYAKLSITSAPVGHTWPSPSEASRCKAGKLLSKPEPDCAQCPSLLHFPRTLQALKKQFICSRITNAVPVLHCRSADADNPVERLD